MNRIKNSETGRGTEVRNDCSSGVGNRVRKGKERIVRIGITNNKTRKFKVRTGR
jgi:hypothetical protein